MAIKGADIIHVGNQVLINRLQAAGPGQVNVPTTKIYELGNYQSVGTVTDIPELTYTLQSIDTTAALESLLLGTNYATDAAGTIYDLSLSKPLDVMGQFMYGKTATNPFNVQVGVAAPFLALESMAYKYGMSANAEQTATLKGDSIFYSPGAMYTQTAVGTGASGQTIALSNPVYPYNGDVINGQRYALAVTLNSGRRLVYGLDFTETKAASGAGTFQVTVNLLTNIAASDVVNVMYSSSTVAAYPQNSHLAASNVAPAAIRGRNIKVFLNGNALSNTMISVQAVDLTYKVNLLRDMEFGNNEVVMQDFDIPDVAGSIEIKPRNPQLFYTQIAQIAGATGTSEVVGALQQGVLSLEIVLYSPVDGSVLKSLIVPDAKFTIPGFNGQVQQKTNVKLNFTSVAGILQIKKGQI